MSNDDQETKLFGAQIDAETAEIINNRLEYGEKSELIQELAQSIAYGSTWDERTPLDIQIESVEEKLAEARRRRREADADVESYENELERLRQKRETTQTKAEKLEASLLPIESDLREGERQRIFPEHGSIEAIAREYNLPKEEIIDELKSRNPDIPDYVFEERDLYNTDEKVWEGVPAEERNTPVENREGLYR